MKILVKLEPSMRLEGLESLGYRMNNSHYVQEVGDLSSEQNARRIRDLQNQTREYLSSLKRDGHIADYSLTTLPGLWVMYRWQLLQE